MGSGVSFHLFCELGGIVKCKVVSLEMRGTCEDLLDN